MSKYRDTPGIPDRAGDLLRGQVAIVTGSSSGIGAAIAEHLGRAGARVCVNYSSSENGAEQTAERIREAGSEAEIVQADVSKESDVKAMFDRVQERWGALHILVTNSGIQKDAAIEDMSIDDWNAVIGVNLTGQFLCMREAVRRFLAQPIDQSVSCAAGKIISIGSVHTEVPWAGHANYAASKGGVDLLTKSIAQEVAHKLIRVNSICPGAIRTPINKDAWETDEAYEQLMQTIPYNRIGEPGDVARLAVWLASDQADYIVGQSLYIDGGMTLYPSFIDNG